MTDNEHVEVPDSVEGLLTARTYRKNAQVALHDAFQCLLGRSGLSADEKRAQVTKALTLVTEAQTSLTNALSLIEDQPSVEFVEDKDVESE